jgi:hypothetical protein
MVPRRGGLVPELEWIPECRKVKCASIEIIRVSGELRNRRAFVAEQLAQLHDLAFVVTRGDEIHELTETAVKLAFTGSRDSQSHKIIEGACAKRPHPRNARPCASNHTRDH